MRSAPSAGLRAAPPPWNFGAEIHFRRFFDSRVRERAIAMKPHGLFDPRQNIHALFPAAGASRLSPCAALKIMERFA